MTETRSDPLPPLHGGCLCGQVRYEARPDHREGYYCHCRMCQLAFGNTRAAFINLQVNAMHVAGRRLIHQLDVEQGIETLRVRPVSA